MINSVEIYTVYQLVHIKSQVLFLSAQRSFVFNRTLLIKNQPKV